FRTLWRSADALAHPSRLQIVGDAASAWHIGPLRIVIPETGGIRPSGPVGSWRLPFLVTHNSGHLLELSLPAGVPAGGTLRQRTRIIRLSSRSVNGELASGSGPRLNPGAAGAISRGRATP